MGMRAKKSQQAQETWHKFPHAKPLFFFFASARSHVLLIRIPLFQLTLSESLGDETAK